MTRPPCEVSWFSALCDDDYEFLGVPDPRLASSWPHCRDIVLQTEAGGFDNILLPSGYALGIDTTAFAGGSTTRASSGRCTWTRRGSARCPAGRPRCTSAGCRRKRGTRPPGGATCT